MSEIYIQYPKKWSFCGPSSAQKKQFTFLHIRFVMPCFGWSGGVVQRSRTARLEARIGELEQLKKLCLCNFWLDVSFQSFQTAQNSFVRFATGQLHPINAIEKNSNNIPPNHLEHTFSSYFFSFDNPEEALQAQSYPFHQTQPCSRPYRATREIIYTKYWQRASNLFRSTVTNLIWQLVYRRTEWGIYCFPFRLVKYRTSESVTGPFFCIGYFKTSQYWIMTAYFILTPQVKKDLQLR